MYTKSSKGRLSLLWGIVVFAVLLVMVVASVGNLSQTARQQGVDALHDALQRAAVLCYATEGFYPPNLAYIQDNYGVQIDRGRYIVGYDVFAPNVMPAITVRLRGGVL